MTGGPATLEDFGADRRRLDEIAAALIAAPGEAFAARVIRVDKGRFTAASAEGEHTVPTVGTAPVGVGDWVVAVTGSPSTVGAGAAAPTLWRVLERRSTVVREAAGKRTELQVLVANVDSVLILVGLDRDFSARQVERFLALAWESGADPVLVLTKEDVAESEHIDRARATAMAVGAGVPVLVTSVVTGTGLEDIRARLGRGQTVALLGTSGGGKSSLVNALIGTDTVATGAVRARDRKGRHTTTWRQLLRVPEGGCVIDTPGLRELGMWISQEGIAAAFSDVSDLETMCRFTDCSHAAEPGCAVLEAVGAGTLDQERLDSYRTLSREAAFIARKFDQRLAAEERRVWKQRTLEGRQRARPRS